MQVENILLKLTNFIQVAKEQSAPSTKGGLFF
jgi:hypothetical protein